MIFINLYFETTISLWNWRIFSTVRIYNNVTILERFVYSLRQRIGNAAFLILLLHIHTVNKNQRRIQKIQVPDA
jgi:hypothetical protein